MTEVWKIEKYARYLNTGVQGQGQWQQYDDSKSDLVLTLTDSSYLVLCQGSTVMESHSLLTARAWMRGMTKRDSMLVMYKVKNETRRFRLKFHDTAVKTAEQQCSLCAERLAGYFPVKVGTQSVPVAENQKVETRHVTPTTNQTQEEDITFQGDVTLGEMAQVVSGKLKAKLPMAYRHCDIKPEDIDDVIRLCLTDPAFPAFVEQVDKQLQSIIAD